MGAARQNEILQPGHRAPDFQLTRSDDGTLTLQELLADGPVLLAFFKSTGPVCQMTLPYLDRIHRGRAPGSFSIYGVSQDDAETTREFSEEFGTGFPMLRDSEESGYPASNSYGISHVPSLFLVASDQTIEWSLEGFNRREFEAMSARAGVKLFSSEERVPEWKSG